MPDGLTEPDWERWHELLDIRDTRGFTATEADEYAEFLPIVAELDAEDEALQVKPWARVEDPDGT
jgi:hypothetical protein